MKNINSREIKFEYLFLNTITKKFVRKNFEIADLEVFEMDVFMLENSNLKLISRREFTGRFDKNKKEIYEGDIVRVNKLTYDNTSEFKPFICVVEYFLDAFHLNVNAMLRLCYGEDIEIIGTMFENTDLFDSIKKSKKSLEC